VEKCREPICFVKSYSVYTSGFKFVPPQSLDERNGFAV
jgi:hypothetical protein